jgi:hypothetical protein
MSGESVLPVVSTPAACRDEHAPGNARAGAERTRAWGLTAAALVFTLAFWTINFGLIDLTDGFTGYVDQQRNAVLDAGWGALFGIVLPLGLLAQLRHPERRIAGLQQTAIVAFALAAAGISGRAWGYLWLAAGVAAMLGLLLALHPARRDFVHRSSHTRPLLVLAGVLATGPCLVYANRTASAQRRHQPPTDAVTNGLHHWTVMCSLALAVVLLTALAGLGTPGWRIPAWSAALGGLAWSLSCLRYPTEAGSEGRAWALAVFVWALAVAAATHLEGHHDGPAQARLPPTT